MHPGSEIKALSAAHQVDTRKAYLGIQDTDWKRHPPSQSTGAWAGSKMRTNDTYTGILVSEE